MNKVERPIRWDTNAKATSVRITKRKKDIILREYDEMMDRGENRDDILENLAEKYGRDTRTIERYISDAREAQEIERRKAMQALHHKEAATLALAKHWDDLAQLAAKLDTMWGEHLDSGRVTEDHDYIADVDLAWVESSSARFAYEVRQLLSHLKAEFSKEFEGIDSWSDLLRSPLPKGCLRRIVLVSKRRTFEGTCEICQGWQK